MTTKRERERKLEQLEQELGAEVSKQIEVRILRGEYDEDETLEERTHAVTTMRP